VVSLPSRIFRLNSYGKPLNLTLKQRTESKASSFKLDWFLGNPGILQSRSYPVLRVPNDFQIILFDITAPSTSVQPRVSQQVGFVLEIVAPIFRIDLPLLSYTISNMNKAITPTFTIVVAGPNWLRADPKFTT
jgi:hypothetical protein